MLYYWLSRILMCLAWSGTIADGFSTDRAIAVGAREAHPVVAWYMRLLTDKWLLARFSYGLFAIASVLMKPQWRDAWQGCAIFGVQVLINWYATINNIIVIRKQRQYAALDSD